MCVCVCVCVCKYKKVNKYFYYLKVEVAFAQFDSSGDDRLDYREFCEMCNKKNI